MKVTLIVAVSADGFIARHKSHLTDWTEPEDKQFFHDKTKELGTLIIGCHTWKTLAPKGPLPGRLNLVMSTCGQNDPPISGQLEFSFKKPSQVLNDLAKRGKDHVALGGGSALATSFMKEGLIDDVYITITPIFFGKGLTIFSNHRFATKLKLLETRKIGKGSVLIHYQIK